MTVLGLLCTYFCPESIFVFMIDILGISFYYCPECTYVSIQSSNVRNHIINVHHEDKEYVLVFHSHVSCLEFIFYDVL